MAIKKQQKYNSQKALMGKMYEDAAIPIRLKSADKKIAKGLNASNREPGAMAIKRGYFLRFVLRFPGTEPIP